MQDVYTKQVAQLSDLIQLINGDSSKNDRKKLITLCTIDVHARDVVQRLIDERVESASAFQWQSQLRYTQHPKTKECQVAWPFQAPTYLSCSCLILQHDHLPQVSIMCQKSEVHLGVVVLHQGLHSFWYAGEHLRCRDQVQL